MDGYFIYGWSKPFKNEMFATIHSFSLSLCVCGAMRCVCIFQCFPCLMVGGYTYYPYVANEIHRFHRSFIQTY